MNTFKIIDVVRNTNLVGEYNNYQRLFAKSETDLRNYQKNNLVRFLLALKNHIFFKMYINGFSKAHIEKEPFTVHKELPITDKNFIKNNFNQILCKNPSNFEYSYTGGSTGNPFNYIVDKKSISHSRAFNYILWNKFLGYNFCDKVIVISGTSLGANAGVKKIVYNFLQNKKFISGDIITKKNSILLVKSINSSNKGVFIYGYPSSILAYIELIDRDEIKLENVKGIITTSEMLFNKNKILIEQYFNTNVLNVYGANDGGIMSGSIDNETFIYNGIDCYVENLQTEFGNELILTNLNSTVFPFVRYRVGDIATLSSTKENPFLLRNLLGRTRDFVTGVKFMDLRLIKYLCPFRKLINTR